MAVTNSFQPQAAKYPESPGFELSHNFKTFQTAPNIHGHVSARRKAGNYTNN